MKTNFQKVILVSLLAALALCALGVTARVSVGDEVHHYRFAKDDFLVQGRAAFDAIYGGGQKPGYFYNTEPLWPLMLSWIWRAIGHISFPAAQIYQAFFYFLLLIMTYLYTSEKYGDETGSWAVWITAAVPMIVSFGMLFYLDVPAMALLMTALWLLGRKRFVLAGTFFAAAVLMKKSMIFFCPALAIALFADPAFSFVRKIANNIFTLVPSFAALGLDMIWRGAHLKEKPVYARHLSFLQALDSVHKEIRDQITLRLFTPTAPQPLPPSAAPYPGAGMKAKEYAVSSFSNAADLIKYFGIVIFALLIFYIVRKCFEKKDGFAWLASAAYLAGVFAFKLLPDVRYFLPVVPFFAGFGAKAVLSLRRKAVSFLIVGLCAAQFGAVAIYTRQYRTISPELQEGFNYIRKNIPEKSVLLYPETNIMEFTERPMVWSLSPQPAIFWGTLIEKATALDYSHVDYIVIKKSRIYDDAIVSNRHLGAYPKSFVEAMPSTPFLEKIWENPQMSIWKVTIEERLNAAQN